MLQLKNLTFYRERIWDLNFFEFFRQQHRKGFMNKFVLDSSLDLKVRSNLEMQICTAKFMSFVRFRAKTLVLFSFNVSALQSFMSSMCSSVHPFSFLMLLIDSWKNQITVVSLVAASRTHQFHPLPPHVFDALEDVNRQQCFSFIHQPPDGDECPSPTDS